MNCGPGGSTLFMHMGGLADCLSLVFFLFPVILQELQYNCGCLHAQLGVQERGGFAECLRLQMLHIGETGWTLHRSTIEGAEQSPDEW